MSLNCREINLVIAETDLVGSLVQNVVQPDYHTLFLEFYDGTATRWLRVCLQAGLTRLHLDEPPRRTKGAQPRFCEFLRARLRGMRLASWGQIGFERVVAMEFGDGTDAMRLYVRLWGNAANVVAVDGQDTVLDAFYRRPAKGEVSGGRWQSPTPGGEPAPERFPVRPWAGQPTFSAHIAEQYRRQSFELDVAGLRERLERHLVAQINRAEARIAGLKRQIAQAASAERYKEFGELVLANAHRAERGAAWLDCEDWYRGGMARIELDPRLDAGANAERFFQKFRKARDGMAFLRRDLDGQETACLEAMDRLAAVRAAVDMDGLRAVDAALDADVAAAARQAAAAGRPGLSYESHGFLLLIGRTAAENDVLLRRHVRGNDYWLHVRDLPGGYVFVKVPREKSVPLEVLVDAAHLAAWYSKAKGQPEVDFFYTQVKYLRRAKHGTFGTVIPTRERNLHVRIEADRVAKLQNLLNGGAD